MTAQQGEDRQNTDRQNTDRQNAEQPVSWLELFFDLVFVTAFDRLAQRLHDHLNWPGFGLFVLYFVALWWAWLGNTNFAARYGNSSRIYRWGTLVQILPLAALAISVRGDVRDVGMFFALAYALGRLVLVGMVVLSGWARVWARAEFPPGDRVLVAGFLLGAALWVVSAFLGGPVQLLLWGLALALDLASTLYAEWRYDRKLPHQGHFPERVGLLFIVFLGAVVTELIRGAAEQRLLVADQLPVALGLITVMALWRLYFDEAHTLPALLAKRSGEAGTLLAWSYTHLPLLLSLSVLSVGLGLGIAEEGKTADQHERLLVSASLALIFGSLALLRALSVRPLEEQHTVGQTGAGQEAGQEGNGASEVLTEAEQKKVSKRALRLSTTARLGGAAAVLLLIPAPISTTGYEALCTAVTLLVAYLSWRDPLRKRLAKIEDRLGEEASGDAASEHGGAHDEEAKGTGRIEQPQS